MAEKTVPAPAEAKVPAAQEKTRSEERYIAPPVDIYEDENGLVVLADLPGADVDSLDVNVDQGILSIQARTQHPAPGTPIYREYQLVNFFRQFELSDRVDVSNIEASMENGVLKLIVPWMPKVRPKRIEVKVAGAK